MKLVSLISFALFIAMATSATAKNFTCSSPASCQSLIGYVLVNTTSLSSIQRMFGIGSLQTLLAANSRPLATPGSTTVRANSTVRIPLPCTCRDGVGRSDRVPIYTVVPEDGLYHIAAEIFSGFVTFPEIQAVNNISNENLIIVGQPLWIPLPCSCDEVDGARVVHYGHKVVNGSSVESIAGEFGTSAATLMTLNGIDDPTSLMADDILDVPLAACASTISNTSLDSSLLVANGSYALTANNCVQCSCNSTNLRLHCEPSQGVSILNWTQCPSMRCDGSGNYLIGNITSSLGCDRTTCSYNGYDNATIFTALSNESTCPAPPPPGNSAAPKMGAQWSSWRWLYHSLYMGLAGFGFLL